MYNVCMTKSKDAFLKWWDNIWKRKSDVEEEKEEILIKIKTRFQYWVLEFNGQSSTYVINIV